MTKTKKCNHCKKLKSFSKFSKDKNTKDGLDKRCKECKLTMRLDQHYGINTEQRQDIFDNQNGCCAICRRHESQFQHPLSVDHNHKTGIIRGLLCDRCNTQLGYYERKRKAAFEKYLKTVPQRMIKVYKKWLKR